MSWKRSTDRIHAGGTLSLYCCSGLDGCGTRQLIAPPDHVVVISCASRGKEGRAPYVLPQFPSLSACLLHICIDSVWRRVDAEGQRQCLHRCGWRRQLLRRQINKLRQALAAHTPRLGSSKGEGDVSDQLSRTLCLTYEIQILPCAWPVERSDTSACEKSQHLRQKPNMREQPTLPVKPRMSANMDATQRYL